MAKPRFNAGKGDQCRMKKGRILVIDDEPSVVDAIMTILSDTGYETIGALSGQEGLERLGRKRFDVAIIDLKLPDMSGLVALSVILDKNPGIVAVLITAHETAELRAEAMAAGFAAVLPKPFSPSALLDVIRDVLPQR